MEKREIPAKNEDALMMKGRTHGTCIAGVIGSDFIMIAADGRGMCDDKTMNDIPWITEENASKLMVHDGDMISAIAGSANKCRRILGEVTDRLLARKITGGIHHFSEECNKVLHNIAKKRKRGGPEPDDDEDFDILCFGFDDSGSPHVYSSKTEICTSVEKGSLHGIGSGFTHVDIWLGDGRPTLDDGTVMGKTQEQIRHQLKMAFVAAKIQDEFSGGFIKVGIISPKWVGIRNGAIVPPGVTTIRSEGHILGIMSTYFPFMTNAYSNVIIVTAYGQQYSPSKHSEINKMLLVRFPKVQDITVLGVVKRREGHREKIIFSLFFKSENKPAGVTYGERERISKGFYIRVRRPSESLFAKYAAKILR